MNPPRYTTPEQVDALRKKRMMRLPQIPKPQNPMRRPTPLKPVVRNRTAVYRERLRGLR